MFLTRSSLTIWLPSVSRSRLIRVAPAASSTSDLHLAGHHRLDLRAGQNLVIEPRLGEDGQRFHRRLGQLEFEVVDQDDAFLPAEDQRGDLDARPLDLADAAVERDDGGEEDEARDQKRGGKDHQDEHHRAVAGQHAGKGRAGFGHDQQHLGRVGSRMSALTKISVIAALKASASGRFTNSRTPRPRGSRRWRQGQAE
jgi:hypothetical protein